MSESDVIAGFGDRIVAALDRIASAADVMVLRPSVGEDEVSALREALEAERATSAQLAERLNAVKSARDALREAMASLTGEVEGLRAQVAELDAARAAATDMQDARAREQAEIAAVIAALAPLVEEAGHA